MNWHVNPQENLSADFHYYNINIFYTWIYVPKKIHMYFLRITFLHKISQVFPVNNVSHKVPQKFPVIFFSAESNSAGNLHFFGCYILWAQVHIGFVSALWYPVGMATVLIHSKLFILWNMIGLIDINDGRWWPWHF